MTPQQLKAMKLALEALKKCRYRSLADEIVDPAITALEEALAEHAMREVQRLGQEIEQEPVVYQCPRCATSMQVDLTAKAALAEHAMSEVQRLGQEIEQEPVAWVAEAVCDGQYIDGRPRKIWWECKKGVGTAFYTTPPQRKPLTDEQIFVIKHNWITTPFANHLDFARAIEAAHDIKENT